MCYRTIGPPGDDVLWPLIRFLKSALFLKLKQIGNTKKFQINTATYFLSLKQVQENYFQFNIPQKINWSNQTNICRVINIGSSPCKQKNSLLQLKFSIPGLITHPSNKSSLKQSPQTKTQHLFYRERLCHFNEKESGHFLKRQQIRDLKKIRKYKEDCQR